MPETRSSTPRWMRTLAVALLIGGLALAAPPAGLSGVSFLVIENFEQGDLTEWIEQQYNGRTHYRIVNDGGNKTLMAQSQASASALGKVVRFDPREFAHLEWRWRIDDIIEDGNALRPDAKDHAAGVFVLFARGKLPWQVDVIEYMWANAVPQGHNVPHPTRQNVRLVAVESGRRRARQWVRERRNIAEDYRELFHATPPRVVAIALMTDTDQTGARATAYYDDFIVRR